MKKLIVLAFVTFGTVAALGGVAIAAWQTPAGPAASSARATSLSQMAAPGASTVASAVTINFPAAFTANGVAARDYSVKRYNSLGVATSINGSCTGTVTLTCSDTNVANGTYSYSVTSKLSSWASPESAKKTVTVNAAPPALLLPGFTNGAIYSASTFPNIAGTTTSVTGVKAVSVSIRQDNGNYWNGSSFSSSSEVMMPASGTNNWTYNFPVGNFAGDGAYSLRVVATDNALNSTSEMRSFTVDKTAPALGFSLPPAIRNGQVFSSNPVDTTSGVSAVAYELCTNETCSTSVEFGRSFAGPSYSVIWTALPSDGNHTLRATAFDNAGNKTSVLATVQVDNSAPTTTDNAVSTWSKTAQTITLSTNDGFGVGGSRTYYTTNGSNPTRSSAQGNTIVFNTDGIYTVKYFSVDSLGNTESIKTASNVVRIDKTIPTTALLGSLPAYTKNGFVLSGGGSDTTSGVASVSYFYCSGTCTPNVAIGSSNTGPTYAYTWNNQPANGTYRVMARTFDNAGNFKDSPVQSTTIDNTAPVAALTSPADDAVVEGNVVITGTASDSTSGIANATFQYRSSESGIWTTIGTDTTAPTYSTTWNSTSLTDGVYDLRMIATDGAGNTFTSAVRSVTIDNAFTPTSMQLINGNGVAGKIDPGDKIVITYSDALDVSTMCSTWSSNNTIDRTLNGNGDVVVTLTNGGSSQDTVSVDAYSCLFFRFGTINLGSTNYLTGLTGAQAIFSGNGANKSTLNWDASAKTLTITLGARSGGSGNIPTAAVSSSVAAYVPNNGLRNIYNLGPTSGVTTNNSQKF